MRIYGRVWLGMVVAGAMLIGALLMLASCTDADPVKTNDQKAEQQEGQPAATPAMKGVVDKQAGDRDPTPQTGTGGAQQSTQPEQPKP